MTDREQRVDQIFCAAIPVREPGFKRTSMADLAEAPAFLGLLYQYFDNRADLFREALQIILAEATDAALAALRGNGLAERIDGYLQRLVADGRPLPAWRSPPSSLRPSTNSPPTFPTPNSTRPRWIAGVHRQPDAGRPATRKAAELVLLSPPASKPTGRSPRSTAATHDPRHRSGAAARHLTCASCGQKATGSDSSPRTKSYAALGASPCGPRRISGSRSSTSSNSTVSSRRRGCAETAVASVRASWPGACWGCGRCRTRGRWGRTVPRRGCPTDRAARCGRP